MPATKRKPSVWTPKTILAYIGWLTLVALICVIFLNLFLSAPNLRDPEGKIGLVDRTTISLNSLGLALVFATLFVGAAAIIGWQKLEDIVRRDIEESNRERLEALETLMQGRVISFIGFAIGELSSEPDQLEPIHKERLAEAVQHCQLGYKLLQKTGKEGPTLNGLNNLVYYSSIYGDASQGRYLLEQARILRAAGDKYGFPPYHLTFCRVVLRYSNDPKEIEEARAIASEVLSRKLTHQEEREAKFYMDALTSKRGVTAPRAEKPSGP